MAGTQALAQLMATAGLVCSSPPIGAEPCPSAATWLRVSQDGPARTGHAMVFDGARGKVVLFGGTGPAGVSGETWTWDGAAWSLAASDGPVARYAPAMAYDASRQRVVLFGGFRRVDPPQYWEPLGDTWEWDGVAWRLASTAGPAARRTALVYDAGRKRVTLHGGSSDIATYSGLVFSDTWEWNGEQWREVATAGAPPGRFSHRLAYESTARQIVMFGGYRPYEGPYGIELRASDETWTFDGATWRFVPGPGPEARANHAMSDGSPVTLASGVNHHEYYNDVWLWNGSAWARRPGYGPVSLSGPAAASDTVRGRVVLFGGAFFSADCACYVYYSTDTHEWSGIASGAILLQPVSLTVDAGLPASFRVEAVRADTYRWRRNGVPLVDDARITGSGAPSLRIDPTTCEDEGLYDVVVTGSVCTSVSDGATLTLRVFARQPEALSRLEFQSARFHSEVRSIGTTLYRWRKGGVPVQDNVMVSGAATPTLLLRLVGASDAGDYDIMVSDACGVHTSSAAPLTVLANPCPGDANHDHAVNMTDLNFVVFMFGEHGGPGDLTLDGVVDFLDLNLVLGNFGRVCDPR